MVFNEMSRYVINDCIGGYIVGDYSVCVDYCVCIDGYVSGYCDFMVDLDVMIDGNLIFFVLVKEIVVVFF